MRRIERLGDRLAGVEQLPPPCREGDLVAASFELQARLAAAQRDRLLVAAERRDLLWRVVGALVEQAVQEEDVEKAHGARADADGDKRIEVHEPDLDILDAALAQRVQRPLAAPDAALGADRAVELVLDLQQRRVELQVRVVERGGVALQAVVAHCERRLRLALVAKPPHAQRRAVRRVHRPGHELLQLVLAAGDEARAHRGRRAEEVEQQPRAPAEIADQREILFAGRSRHGQVVVNAGDGLHAPAVAVRQALAIDGLGAPDVGGAVAADRNRVVARQIARHRARPHQLVARIARRIARDGAVDHLVDLGQLLEAGVEALVRAGDELELRLAEIGGDVRMRERRAERLRMRKRRERAVGAHAQALLLDTAADALQDFRREGAHGTPKGSRRPYG